VEGREIGEFGFSSFFFFSPSLTLKSPSQQSQLHMVSSTVDFGRLSKERKIESGMTTATKLHTRNIDRTPKPNPAILACIHPLHR